MIYNNLLCDTGLRAGGSGVKIWAGARYFALLQNVQTGFQARIASYPVVTGKSAWGYNSRGQIVTNFLCATSPLFNHKIKQ
jgi:hypothetical protein